MQRPETFLVLLRFIQLQEKLIDFSVCIIDGVFDAFRDNVPKFVQRTIYEDTAHTWAYTCTFIAQNGIDELITSGRS